MATAALRDSTPFAPAAERASSTRGLSTPALADADERERFEREALCWFPDVARYALSLTRDPVEAEDLVQETFFRACRWWHTYRPGSECRAWLFTICRSAFLRLRECERRETRLDEPALGEIAWRAGRTSSEARWDVDLRAAIDRALATLPEHFRSALVLVDLEDHAYDSAAALLGVPVGTVRSRLFRARRLLRHSLRRYAEDAGLATDEESADDE